MMRALTRNLSLTVLLVMAATALHAAEFQYTPSIGVSEEFTDNVYEDAGPRRHEFTTRVRPGLALRYQAPRLQWDSAYTFDYRRYERNSRDDEITHDAKVGGKLTLVENLLFVDFNDSYSRVSQDISRDVTNQGLFRNQTDQNIATVSPYFTWRLEDKTTLKTGYRYNDVRYWGVGIEKREHTGFANLSREMSDRLVISADYSFTRSDQESTYYTRHSASGGFRYQYGEKSFLFGNAGNSWSEFSRGTNSSNLFWSAGITHDLGFAVATLDTSTQFTEDPLAVSTLQTTYGARLDKTLDRGSIGISSAYSEYVNTETDKATERKFSLGANGRYDLLRDLSVSLSLLGERFHIVSADNFPYRFSATAGMNYLLGEGLSLGLTYTYVAYHYDLEVTNTAKEINRAVIDLRKTF